MLQPNLLDLPLSPEMAIDRNLLLVAPDTPLVEVINRLSQTRIRSCTLPDANHPAGVEVVEPHRSCALVIQQGKVAGIFTERDIVWLTATGMDFTGIKVADVMAHPVITLPQTAFQDVFAALFLFRRYRIRHLPILDEQDYPVGIVTPNSIRKILQPANLLRLRRVSDVMSTNVVHAPGSTSVLGLARLMAEQRVSCVVITEAGIEGGFQPVGIVTERDIVQFQALQINLETTQAHAVMSTPLFLLTPEDSLWTAHQEMQRRHIGRLVVSWNRGKGLGIVTQTSLLRVFDPMEMYWVIESLQQTIRQLQTNPTESYPEADTATPPLVSDRPSHALPHANVPPLPLPRAAAASLSPHSDNKEEQMRSLVNTAYTCLKSLTNGPTPQRDSRLQLALANLEELSKLLETSEPKRTDTGFLMSEVPNHDQPRQKPGV